MFGTVASAAGALGPDVLLEAMAIMRHSSVLSTSLPPGSAAHLRLHFRRLVAIPFSGNQPVSAMAPAPQPPGRQRFRVPRRKIPGDTDARGHAPDSVSRVGANPSGRWHGAVGSA